MQTRKTLVQESLKHFVHKPDVHVAQSIGGNLLPETSDQEPSIRLEQTSCNELCT